MWLNGEAVSRCSEQGLGGRAFTGEPLAASYPAAARLLARGCGLVRSCRVVTAVRAKVKASEKLYCTSLLTHFQGRQVIASPASRTAIVQPAVQLAAEIQHLASFQTCKISYRKIRVQFCTVAPLFIS